ncbi:homoserine dehydrogenase [Clostridium tyrobutyricum]|uniref:homoserine dehydrogenase n=1 Tax=Clostridium tyrobutyricum TaxID=1519 RepID=UPI001C38AF64|nr:homoserine dehydrogenase [Clostridium tyrobutyricum]MBV4424440.1 homoserine dehydrogenase [Clostridium tyrobutyricum]MEA5007479.1 homoserine dehydrogenase [Clostridium tyrobutyricum]
MAVIAMLGYGVVGSGVAELILKNRNKFKSRLDEELTISNILVRSVEKYKDSKYKELITNNIEDIFKKKVDIVVEAMGGLNPSYEYIKRALKMKKHVVTANKDLIAEYGHELLELAKENGVSIHFEASVGGGIPILKSMNECLVGNDIKSIRAILNGTTNFILSKMNHENMGYDEALKLAQDLGFAEANPESDVMGYDAARKLSILSTIAYNKRIYWKDMGIEGITNIDDRDFRYARTRGCSIKLLGISEDTGKDVFASVRPIIVKENSVLGRIEDEYNAILVEGDAVGDVLFTGKGAGMFPTASAVFADIADIIMHKEEESITFNDKKAEINKEWELQSEWLVRLKTHNRIEVIESITENFTSSYILASAATFDDDEVVAFIKSENEHNLNKYIENLRKREYIRSAKKILISKN